MKYSEAKKYVNAKRIWGDIFITTISILTVLFIISLIVTITTDTVRNYNKVLIVRDTIYQKMECKITGPNKYVDYISDRHGLELMTSDGKYTIKVQP
jgi:hypothetical protein